MTFIAYIKIRQITRSQAWAQENKIPAAKIGREWRFRKAVVDKWFNDQMNEKFRNY
jgi:hypothetical protein